ncbi:glycosyltransferase [Flavobacterium psychraquaticum]|uniref:glycosyltransferase n=1 Tax=Flavobacterium psychraquaticum TaxID=3103958 RepID=UPI002ACDCCED|nr:glycosyltransferase [Flavobacterium sp. LB-N7T]
MKLFFITDARFYQTPDGNIYSGEFSFSDILWRRYKQQFFEIYVLARLFYVEDFVKEENKITEVTILPIEAFESSTSFLTLRNKIKNVISLYFNEHQPHAVIIRGAGSIGYLASRYCIAINMSYGIEVIGDPYDVFAPGVIKHPLRAVLRRLFTYYQKKAVYNASSVIYVTQNKLQTRYPSNPKAFQTYASDVAINEVVRNVKKINNYYLVKLISVGSLEQMYKGPDILLKAVKLLVDKNIKVSLTWLGHGTHLQEMAALADNLDIGNYVDFKGSVDNETLIKDLDESDIFVLASRTEGLPRAIVEAMARSLPCIGSNVGGIPELVNTKLLFDVENSKQLADKIELLISDANFYEKMSDYSIKKATNFSPSVLDKRRNSFFESLVKNKNYR